MSTSAKPFVLIPQHLYQQFLLQNKHPRNEDITAKSSAANETVKGSILDAASKLNIPDSTTSLLLNMSARNSPKSALKSPATDKPPQGESAVMEAEQCSSGDGWGPNTKSDILAEIESLGIEEGNKMWHIAGKVLDFLETLLPKLDVSFSNGHTIVDGGDTGLRIDQFIHDLQRYNKKLPDKYSLVLDLLHGIPISLLKKQASDYLFNETVVE